MVTLVLCSCRIWVNVWWDKICLERFRIRPTIHTQWHTIIFRPILMFLFAKWSGAKILIKCFFHLHKIMGSNIFLMKPVNNTIPYQYYSSIDYFTSQSRKKVGNSMKKILLCSSNLFTFWKGNLLCVWKQETPCSLLQHLEFYLWYPYRILN